MTPSAIGLNLKHLRALNGLSQAELAARLGWSTAYVCLYERGRRELDATKLFRFARALGVSVDALFVDVGGVS